MARLPDESAVGAIDARASGRAIATYDTSGYARGAAAIGDGFKDLGGGIATVGKAMGASAAQKAAEEKLQRARINAELTAKELARANAIETESDPVGLVARHADEAAKEFEQSAQRIADPQRRLDLLPHRDGYVAGIMRAARQREGVLSASAEMTRDWEVADALGHEALQSTDPSAFNRTADAFHGLVDAWYGSGLIDDAKAADIKRNWAAGIAEQALLKASPADRVQAIAAATTPVAVDTAEGADQPAADAAAPRSYSDLAQLARMLPADVQARMQYEAQSELERQNTRQIFDRTEHYEDRFNRALENGAPLPSGDDIAFDPALDAPSRARLEQRREKTVQELENYAWFRAKFDDVNAGSFDAVDPETRRFLDRIYKARGASDAALYVAVRRAGMIPPTARSTMLGDLASRDPARVKRAVETAFWISEEFPSLLSIEEDGEILLNAVTQYRHETARGASAEQAIKRIVELQSSEYQSNLNGRRKSIDVTNAVEKAISVTDLIGLYAVEPDAAASMFSLYADLVKDRYDATDDMPLAKAQARALLESRWNLASQIDPSSQSDPEKKTPPTWLELLGETWPGQAVRAAYSGFTLAGDVAAGRVKTEDELMERVFDMAGLITGGSFVKPQVAAPGEVILGMGATRAARKIRPIVDQKASLGTSATKEYRKTFFKAYPDAAKDTVVHHAIEQRVLKMYKGVISESEMHSLQNLRGIPHSKNNDLHLRTIRKEWDDFYLKNPTTTRRKLLNKAMEIDRKYGSQFIPPLKFTKQPFA